MPTFADEINLPQVAAFALETLRWRPVSDLGTCQTIKAISLLGSDVHQSVRLSSPS